MKLLFSLLFTILIAIGSLNAQSKHNINIFKTTSQITLDGVLEESEWQQDVDVATNFFQYFPTDSLQANEQTAVRMCFDDKNLYVAIECFSSSSDYVVPTLRRDYRAGGNDNVTLLIDPFNDGTNAFMFGTNPRGVIREGLITNGGTSNRFFSTSWDNKWKSETKITEAGWITEMAIPFSTLRFNKNNQVWRFNSYRFDMQSNERSSWMNIPRNQNIINLGYMGTMTFQVPINASGSKLSFIPYSIASMNHDVENEKDREFNFNIGGDAKIAINSGLNLDLTINPDFSQVEVDRQVTNLSRFEIFFPERRQFFLENADLFSGFGTGDINPFFSRRIGIASDTTEDVTIQNTIYGGARLSGKLNDKWRVGLLSMQTAREDKGGQSSLNHTVGAVQRRIGPRSNIGLIVVNKQALDYKESDGIDKYNRVVGIDYNLATVSNLWAGKTFFHKSFSVDQKDKSYATGLQLQYNTLKHRIDWVHRYVGEGYDAQNGFVSRTNYYRISPEYRYYIYPRSSILNRASISVEFEQFWKPNFGKTDQQLELGWRMEFGNNSNIDFSIKRRYIYLFDDFDPTGTDSAPLPSDSDYSYFFIDGGIGSDRSKKLSARLNPYIGQYFNGKRYGARGSVNYRIEPYGSIDFNYNYNVFDMPHLDELKSTLLLGPRINVTLTKDKFITTFIQYNSQSQNTNINARFQWRFAPVSDFFLVYSDNYFSGNPGDPSDRFAFNLRNRSIVMKIAYWLNM